MRRRIVVIAIAVIAAGLTPGLEARALPPLPELWMMNADGTGERELAPDTDARGVSWSPDGTKLAYASASLIVLDIASGQRTELTQPPEYPTDIAWSSDGSKIAYSFGDVDRGGIRTISPDGTNKQTLVDAAFATSALGPDWAPDAGEISFLYRPGSDEPPRVAVVDVATREIRIVSHTAAAGRTEWSPDGNWIAYYESSGPNEEPFVGVRIVRPDGLDDHSVSLGLSYAEDATWEPVGDELAFFGFTSDSEDAERGVWITSPHGIPELVVPDGRYPTWSPDGTRLAYAMDGDIYAIVRSTGAAERLTEHTLGDDTSPRWSPSGARIAFARTRVVIMCPVHWSVEPREATIAGTEGADMLHGTDGPDVIVGLGGNDVIKGLGDDDVICGGPGDDLIQGAGGDDRLYGEGENDDLRGGDGDDSLDGGSDDDSISGGKGRDAVRHLGTFRPLHVDLAAGTAQGFGNDSLVSIEDASGWGVLLGTPGPNHLVGMFSNDVIRGRGGPDELDGSTGGDKVYGGRGNDDVYGGEWDPDASDDLYGGPGTDVCTASDNDSRYYSCERRG